MSASELSSLDDPMFRRELLVVAGFLAGYGTTTRNGYATDLRLFADWCRDYGLNLFEVQRSPRRALGSIHGSPGAHGLHRRSMPLGVGQLLPVLGTRRPRRP